MFFEDEKDIIKEGAEIHIDEDGTVTWEDVLSSDDDIIIDETDIVKAPAKNKTVRMVEEHTSIQNVEEDVNDQELIEILNEPKKPKKKAKVKKHTAPKAPEEDFDLDSKLADAALDDDDDIKPEKRSQKKDDGAKKSAPSPILLVLLLVVLIAAGVFYGSQFLTQNEAVAKASKAELDLPKTPQREMNNITQEQLEQRQQIAQQAPQEQQPAPEVPVVNEQQASEVTAQEEEAKKEEEKIEEKKQVVHLVPTGRDNPFMPIQKYATSSIPDTAVMYDRSGIPKPPDSYGEKEKEVSDLMSISVSGIMYDSVKPSAIITHDDNDYFVQKGDKLDDYRIVEIGKTYVMIALGQNVYKANIGEEFKIDTKQYGIAEYIPPKNGGGKQYYSVSDRGNYNKPQDRLRYTSEDDITINARY